jgi:hypothetical protein
VTPDYGAGVSVKGNNSIAVLDGVVNDCPADGIDRVVGVDVKGINSMAVAEGVELK